MNKIKNKQDCYRGEQLNKTTGNSLKRGKTDTPSTHSGPGTGTSIIDRDKLVL